jgi:O-acetyl-ADP-ribose deacetylase (regulator of RNase III)
MITYRKGDMFKARVEALVNAVNEVGVMGKGLALQFRDAYPESAREYVAAAQRGDIQGGHVLAVPSRSMMGPAWIIHFPTKRHWRHPSRIEWIREGLDDLVRVVDDLGIKSIAVPPIGCGNGGLDWNQVRPLIDAAFARVPGVEVVVFEPFVQCQAAPKTQGVEKLTPACALVAEVVRRYSVLGLGCTNLEVQKLAWFLQRMLAATGAKNPLRLQFAANRYGPYADQLRHLLDALDGSYLHCDKRMSEAGPFEVIHFRDDRRDAVAEYLAGPALEYAVALEATTRLIDGFESPLGMELLATVDWLVAREGCEPTVDAIKSALVAWPSGTEAGRRKLGLFDDRTIALALERLAEPADMSTTLGGRLC